MSWKDKIKEEKPETKKRKLRISSLVILLTLAFASIVMIILWIIGILPYQSLLAWIVMGMVIVLLVLAYDKDKRALENRN
jgi:membrane protein YdbS with pleckstrin-like domain